jgi:uncharacterized repeat protein (TIGR04138 family)
LEDANHLEHRVTQAGMRLEGVHVLLSLVHSLSLQRAQRGLLPHLDAGDVVGHFFGQAQERFGVLALDVLREWGLAGPVEIGQAIGILVDEDLLTRSEDEHEDDYAQLPPPPEDWPRLPVAPSLRETVNWTGF